MRFIPIDNLPAEYDNINGVGSFALWLAEAESHLNNIRNLAPAERGAYWSKHSIWTKLYSTLSACQVISVGILKLQKIQESGK